MKQLIYGKYLDYQNDIRENDTIRASFVSLAKQTFGLDFEPWYRQGYWNDHYIPHVLLDGDKVVANVSVNMIDTTWQGEKKRYIQLGTIMTDTDYQNQGLARWLINTVLNEWQDNCNAVYLFANDSVLNFYPKFGFSKVDEYQCSMPITAAMPSAEKLNMDKAEEITLLLEMYRKGNSFSRLPMLGNTDLLMFYCAQFMKNNVYYCKELDAVVIAEFENDCMVCYDVFGGRGKALTDILSAVAPTNIKSITFGFTPLDTEKMETSLLKEENTTLFLLSTKENIFQDNKLMFPLLSHA